MQHTLFILLIILRCIPCTCLVSKVTGDIILRSIFDEGISSLSFNSFDHSVYMGTKRGRLKKIVCFEQDEDQLVRCIETSLDDVETNNKALKPYPIYSLHTCHNGKTIFCGGGDRYITIWSFHLDCWSITQRLGPHTGWVKDLATFNELYLFSIGCNCIEIWDIPNKYKHYKKLEIQSCSKFGATLSSDLLCLGVHETFLFAGGVDGRIHKWDIGNEFKYHEAVSVHDGRINKMLLLNHMKILLSVGNDGYIRYTDLTQTTWDNSRWISWRLISDSIATDEELVRIISICSIQEAENEVKVAIGTSCGMVRFLSIVREPVGNSITLNPIEYKVHLEDRSTISSLQFYPRDTRSDTSHGVILVGHSNGAALLTPNFLRYS